MPKVSVVVPVYNTEKYLGKCLDSLVAQTLSDIEIICIDDKSTDGSLDVLKVYSNQDNRIKIIEFKENKGAGAARNAGIDAATSEYVGFVDSDDYVDVDFYEKLYQKAVETNADIVKGNLYYSMDGAIRYTPYFNLKEVKENKVAFIHVPTAIFKKDFLCTANLRYPEDLKYSEDSVFEVEASLKANKIELEDRVAYYYITRNESLNKTQLVTMNRIQEIEKSVCRVIDILNASDLTKEDYLYAISKRCNYLSVFIQRKNTPDEVKEYVKKAEKNIISKVKYPFEFRQLMMKQKVQDMWNQKLKEKEMAEHSIDKKALDAEINGFKDFGVNQMPRSEKIIVSLTSFPERMYDIHYCLYSLLKQTLKPDAVVLWLGDEQFPNKEADIPEAVLKLKENGLTIKWTKDIKSYTKLIPALKEYSSDVIVTADDDVFYASDWLEKLYETHQKYPKDIICHRAHKVRLNEEGVMPYATWDKCIQDESVSHLNFLTGVGGVLYFPHSLHQDTLKEDLFLTLSPKADDVWFWAMAVHNGTRINLIQNNGNAYTEIPGTQNNALCKYNVEGKGNDQQLSAVLKAYPDILKKLDKKQKNYKDKSIKISVPIFGYKNKQGNIKIKLLGIPVFAIKRKANKLAKRLYVMGFPILKIKKNPKHTIKKIYLLGIPVWIHHKK